MAKTYQAEILEARDEATQLVVQATRAFQIMCSLVHLNQLAPGAPEVAYEQLANVRQHITNLQAGCTDLGLLVASAENCLDRLRERDEEEQ